MKFNTEALASLGMTASRRADDAWSEPEDSAPVRGVLRTLKVLRALNVHNGATVVELSRVTGISRGALYRLLETLREEGYVALDLSRRHYCLTMLVRCLAEGFADEDWVRHVARPILRRLQRGVVWPTDLGTFMDNSMWIRETTRPLSPLTIDRAVVGLRFPMLRGATGRAYLAWCPDDEREQILQNLTSAREPGYEIVLDRARLDALLDQTRVQRYGCRFGDAPIDTGAIAVPILCGNRILGCVNLTFIRRGMTPAKAAHRCLAQMWEAANEIARRADALHRKPENEPEYF
jgi:IclR family mhp operon transcriptional activator